MTATDNMPQPYPAQMTCLLLHATSAARFDEPTLAARGAASGRRAGRYRASGRPAAPALTLSLIFFLFTSWGCSAPDAGRTAPVPRAERSVVLVTLEGPGRGEGDRGEWA